MKRILAVATMLWCVQAGAVNLTLKPAPVVQVTPAAPVPTGDNGTYVPSAPVADNVYYATPWKARWSKVGNIVTVAGTLAVTPQSSNNVVVVYLTLPIPSTLGGRALSGTLTTANGSSGIVNEIGGGFNEAVLVYAAPNTAADTVSFVFSYEVLP